MNLVTVARRGYPVVLFLVTSSVLSAGDDLSWPGWRGPSRDGQVPGRQWPTRLDESTLEKVWHVELGPSYSGPVVGPRAIFVTETVDKKYEAVRALDRDSGDELWSKRWEGAMNVPFFAAANGSWIRSTPYYDGERLYVAGMRDVLVCLEGATGKEIWRVDFTERFKTPLPNFGFVCSPLVTDKHVYVQAGGSFVKLDKFDGKTVWRTLEDGGGMYGSAFSSPILAVVRGVPQVLVQTRQKLAGVSPDTGEELWSIEIPAFRGMNIITPTLHGERVFTSTYGGGSRLVEIGRDGEEFRVAEAWKDPAQGYMSSPVVVDGHAYLHLRNRRFTCFDLATGKRKWTSTERFGKYMSLVSQGDRILALDERGKLFLIRANPEKLEVLDSRDVSEDSTWAHVAVVGNHVLVRELGGLSVWRWGPSSRVKVVHAGGSGI